MEATGPLLYVVGSPTFTIVIVKDSDLVRFLTWVIQSPTSTDPEVIELTAI